MCRRISASRRRTADPKGIEELANLFAGAKHPVIVTEDAGKTRKSVELLVEIAELLGCPWCETRSTGVDQFSAHPSAAQWLRCQRRRAGRRRDFSLGGHCALASGVDYAVEGAKVAMLDENPLRIEIPYYGYQSDLCLTGEIESSLEHLLAALKKKVSKGDSARKRRAEELKAKNDARRKKWREEAAALANQKPMDTRWVAHEISQVLPEDAMVVEETITHRLAMHRYLDN